MIINLLISLLLIFSNQKVSERGYTIWIGNCGYSYYMTKTDDGLPAMFGNTKTFEEAEQIVRTQKKRDNELRKQLRVIK